jgi:hypothetical protein
MRFVCAVDKTELRFPKGTKYEDANAEIGRRGWTICPMPDPAPAKNARWALCCPSCVKTLAEAAA